MVADEIALTVRIRRRLGTLWQPIFGRFGRLTPIQLALIPAMLSGKDALACAPTASGKTEAALAPIALRLSEGEPTGGIRAVWVVPTRALVNDLDQRMRGPLRDAGISLGVRTGDRREVRAGRMEDLVVTTPESLDSMIGRIPGGWTDLQACVLDEIHLLDGTPRGDQLRVLLQRLRAEAPRGFQTVALSATLNDPAAVAARYLHGDPAVIQVGGARTLSQTVVASLEEAVALLRAEERHKALIFGNTRRAVEETALALRDLWPADRIAVHHGSLARKERESVEAAMRSWRWGLLVATMTLELGVDVGDIDAVLLLGPPSSPSSYQQRIGRANRREAVIRVIGIAATEPEAEAFASLSELAREGVVEARGDEPDTSVIVQQVLSITWQRRSPVAVADLTALLAPIDPEGLLPPILDYLADEGWLRRTADRYSPTERTMDLGERGTLHSNIPDSRELALVDATSGRPIGKLTTGATPGSRLLFAGRGWLVQSVSGKTAVVSPVPRDQAAAAFGKRSDVGAFRWLLPPALR